MNLNLHIDEIVLDGVQGEPTESSVRFDIERALADRFATGPAGGEMLQGLHSHRIESWTTRQSFGQSSSESTGQSQPYAGRLADAVWDAANASDRSSH